MFRYRSALRLLKRTIVPPLIAELVSSALWRHAPRASIALMLDGPEYVRDSREWSLFRSAVGTSRRCFEWGSGNSTLYVGEQDHCQVMSIESDAIWAESVAQKLTSPNVVVHVDIGPVGSWGRPTSFKEPEKFMDYLAQDLLSEFAPDLVLIDGRFRVACFLTALIACAPGTRIVVDDYSSRPQYLFIERFCTPKAAQADQAMFIRPNEIDELEVKRWLERFSMVTD